MPGELENISKKMRELVDGMKSSFQKASANISGHIGEVMSDEIKANRKMGYPIQPDMDGKCGCYYGCYLS